MTKKKTVVVGMSGGVDSSVTALLLKEEGYNIIGIHLQLWVDPLVPQGELESKCCSVENILRTRQVADKLGIPFYNIDIIDEFKRKVVDYYLDSYKKGVTPNPCIVCNRDIKFGLVLEKLQEFGADYWATGHYAKIGEENGTYYLEMGDDPTKDQTYFLYMLSQEALSKSIFPLGKYTKKEVKKIARKFKIKSFKEEYVESQNLCFYPEEKPKAFLDRYLADEMKKEGPIKKKDGTIIGTHNSLYHYTIGQRKGLTGGGHPEKLYVIGKSEEENTVYVGEDKDLYGSECLIEDPHFIDESFPDQMSNLWIKIRYTKTPAKGSIEKQGKQYKIIFDKPVRAITPGQSAVFYQERRLVGGGIIV